MPRLRTVKPNAELLVQVEFVRGLLSGLVDKGIEFQPYLRRAGIAPTYLAQADSQGVTVGQYTSLMYGLARGLKDEGVGLFSRPFKPGSFGILLRAGTGATDLRVALRRMASVFNVLQDDLHASLVVQAGVAGFTLRPERLDGEVPVFLVETLVKMFWRLSTWLTDGAIHVRTFDFSFAEPAYVGEYATVFPAALRFGREAAGMWFDAAALKSPVVRDELAMRVFLADIGGQIIAPRRSRGIVCEKVRGFLLHSYPAWPEIGAAAAHLNMSRATLQRQLVAEHASYQQVKDGLRRDLAIAQLSTSDMQLNTLALELGFSNSSALQRAFKHWTGKSCGDYRAAGGE